MEVLLLCISFADARQVSERSQAKSSGRMAGFGAFSLIKAPELLKRLWVRERLSLEYDVTVKASKRGKDSEYIG